jgi:hypothetical protein
MLVRDDLYSLEEYAKIREQFKRHAIAHRKSRQVPLGTNMTLAFEDRMTVKYQIQEMLHIERTFEQNGIQDELDAYNPLIPTGQNLKATLTIEYGDPDVRAQKLAELKGVEDTVFVQVFGHEPVYAIANEDIPRSNDEKTSAVHFMRFELTDAMIRDIQSGRDFFVGVDHSKYQVTAKMQNTAVLLEDFNENSSLVGMVG